MTPAHHHRDRGKIIPVAHEFTDSTCPLSKALGPKIKRFTGLRIEHIHIVRADRALGVFLHKLNLLSDLSRKEQIVTVLKGNKISTAFQQAERMIPGDAQIGLV